jgi:uncharacterized phage protein (TIGR01671 family)
VKEIKFRAWDKENKIMITDIQNFIPLIVTNKGVLRLNPCHKENFWEFIDSNRFELMQYTGLKDKNGKEIYDGYIIQGLTTWAFEVLIKQGHTKIRWKDSDKQIIEEDLFQSYIDSDELEIICNIYENPELLEAEQ